MKYRSLEFLVFFLSAFDYPYSVHSSPVSSRKNKTQRMPRSYDVYHTPKAQNYVYREQNGAVLYGKGTENDGHYIESNPSGPYEEYSNYYPSFDSHKLSSLPSSEEEYTGTHTPSGSFVSGTHLSQSTQTYHHALKTKARRPSIPHYNVEKGSRGSLEHSNYPVVQYNESFAYSYNPETNTYYFYIIPPAMNHQQKRLDSFNNYPNYKKWNNQQRQYFAVFPTGTNQGITQSPFHAPPFRKDLRKLYRPSFLNENDILRITQTTISTTRGFIGPLLPSNFKSKISTTDKPTGTLETTTHAFELVDSEELRVMEQEEETTSKNGGSKTIMDIFPTTLFNSKTTTPSTTTVKEASIETITSIYLEENFTSETPLSTETTNSDVFTTGLSSTTPIFDREGIRTTSLDKIASLPNGSKDDESVEFITEVHQTTTIDYTMKDFMDKTTTPQSSSTVPNENDSMLFVTPGKKFKSKKHNSEKTLESFPSALEVKELRTTTFLPSSVVGVTESPSTSTMNIEELTTQSLDYINVEGDFQSTTTTTIVWEDKSQVTTTVSTIASTTESELRTTVSTIAPTTESQETENTTTTDTNESATLKEEKLTTQELVETTPEPKVTTPSGNNESPANLITTTLDPVDGTTTMSSSETTINVTPHAEKVKLELSEKGNAASNSTTTSKPSFVESTIKTTQNIIESTTTKKAKSSRSKNKAKQDQAPSRKNQTLKKKSKENEKKDLSSDKSSTVESKKIKATFSSTNKKEKKKSNGVIKSKMTLINKSEKHEKLPMKGMSKKFPLKKSSKNKSKTKSRKNLSKKQSVMTTTISGTTITTGSMQYDQGSNKDINSIDDEVTIDNTTTERPELLDENIFETTTVSNDMKEHFIMNSFSDEKTES
uniref:Uncharacterized protein n=1 Tax=Lepeophtheirus salmonis TaxID=72036 RepID=A0A0K2UHH1_LEPSM